jgi:hypothetical protein
MTPPASFVLDTRLNIGGHLTPQSILGDKGSSRMSIPPATSSYAAAGKATVYPITALIGQVIIVDSWSLDAGYEPAFWTLLPVSHLPVLGNDLKKCRVETEPHISIYTPRIIPRSILISQSNANPFCLPHPHQEHQNEALRIPARGSCPLGRSSPYL